MSLTFEQQLADVPKQLENYPSPHLDDMRLRAMLCNENQKMNTVGKEVTAYALQTPLQDYIVFGLANSTGDFGCAYYKNVSTSRKWIRAPNASFLVEKGAIPVADLGRIRLPEFESEIYVHNRLYYSSVSQIAIELILDLDDSSYTRYLSRNVSNLTCILPIQPVSTPSFTTTSLIIKEMINSSSSSSSSSSDTTLYTGLSVMGAVIILFLGLILYYYFFIDRPKRITKNKSVLYRHIPLSYSQNNTYLHK